MNGQFPGSILLLRCMEVLGSGVKMMYMMNNRLHSTSTHMQMNFAYLYVQCRVYKIAMLRTKTVCTSEIDEICEGKLLYDPIDS